MSNAIKLGGIDEKDHVYFDKTIITDLQERFEGIESLDPDTTMTDVLYSTKP